MDAELAVHIAAGPDWLAVRVEGAYDFARVSALIPTVAKAAKAAQARAVLMDMTGVAGQVGFSDRFNFAVLLAQQGFRVPIAAVGAESMVDPRRFGELVAQNRGLEMKVFTDVASAETWLRSRLTPPC